VAPGTTRRRSSRSISRPQGTALHDASIVGDTVGDPYKDTSSVALNPVIKFTTLFGLLAVELAVSLTKTNGTLVHVLAAVFFAVSAYFVWRSFYGMRIPGNLEDATRALSGQNDDELALPSPEAIVSPATAVETVSVGEI